MKQPALYLLLVTQMVCWLLLSNHLTSPTSKVTGSFTLHPTIGGRPLTPDEHRRLNQRFAAAFSNGNRSQVSVDDQPGGDTVVHYLMDEDEVPSVAYFGTEDAYRQRLEEFAASVGSQNYNIGSAGSGPLGHSSNAMETAIKFVGFVTAVLALVAVGRTWRAETPAEPVSA